MRQAAAVMADLAASGLSPEQQALLMELSAAVTAEARPVSDRAAQNKREYDRQYQAERRKNRTTSYESRDHPSPNERDNLTPTRESKTEAKASSKSLVEEEKREALVSCIRKAFPAPEGVTEEQWEAFRKQRRKSLNSRSYALLTGKLAKLAEAGWPPGEMIDLAIERGWETVFAPRNFDHGHSASNVTSLRGTRPDPALDLLRAARAAEDRENHRGVGASLPAIGSS